VLLLHLFPEGVEELDGAFAVYADEPPIGFDVLEADDVREGWEDSWREFHHGVAVGRFWVGPPWEDPPPELEPIVVDPGRAFGTGAHATTRLSLELLQSIEPGSLLDIGCGSGVLSIGAAKLGFAPVTGVDLDEAAIEATTANARVNGVEIAAHVADALADALPRTEIAVANVALDVVERLAPRLDTTTFVTSGYLDRDEPALPGWERADRRTADGWAADLFQRIDWRSARLSEDDLELRPWEDGDQDRLGTSLSDPLVGRYFGKRLDVAEGAPLPDDPDAPIFAIVAGGAVVGVIWFARGIRPFDVGYYLHPDVWGRGLATRSLSLVSDWMLSVLGERRVVLHTHPANERSKAVAQRAGYASAGVVDPYARFKDGSTAALRYVRDR